MRRYASTALVLGPPGPATVVTRLSTSRLAREVVQRLVAGPRLLMAVAIPGWVSLRPGLGRSRMTVQRIRWRLSAGLFVEPAPLREVIRRRASMLSLQELLRQAQAVIEKLA
jgi:hypothetical protein